MPKLARRSFLSGAAVCLAGSSLMAGAPAPSEAPLVWKASEWNLAAFQKLAQDPARVKEVCDVAQINDGRFLGNIKNGLNGMIFGFGVPRQQIKIVAALHGPANLLNYDDYVWKRYRLGEWQNVIDPATGRPAEKNIFHPRKNPPMQEGDASDPGNLHSPFQDASIEALQARGVQFLSCHTATVEQARALIQRNNLPQSSEEVVADMLAHALAGVLVVASMGAAIALLQAEGHYAYAASS